MPELIKFFEQIDCPDWKAQLERFLQTFNGTEFIVPSADALLDMARDEKIVRLLRADSSPESRLRIIRENNAIRESPKRENSKISHQYLEGLWRACEDGRNLEQPACNSRAEALRYAATLYEQHLSLLNDIVAMFRLSAAERQKIMAMVNKKKGPKHESSGSPRPTTAKRSTQSGVKRTRRR